MELNEKIQELRKQKGLTQEELSEVLFVSRAAVSKWESGRGYPNIDSLKAIAKFFGVTIDELLLGEELLTIAEEDIRQKENRYRDLVFGLLDCGMVIFFFLPLFGQKETMGIQAVSLLSFTGIASYIRNIYSAVVIGMVVTGILVLALQNDQGTFWAKHRSKVSFSLHVVGTLLFIAGSQPYAASLLFVCLIIKVIICMKKQ